MFAVVFFILVEWSLQLNFELKKCRVWSVKGKTFKNCFFGTAATRTSTSTKTSSSTSTKTSSSTSTKTSTSAAEAPGTALSSTLKSSLFNMWLFSNSMVDYVTGQSLLATSNASYMADRYGNANQALSLSTGYVTIPTQTAFNGDFSVSMWLYPRTIIDHQRILLFQDQAVWARVDTIDLILSSGSSYTPRLYMAANSVEYGSCQPNFIWVLNSWQHMGLTLTGSTVQWYYNGAAIAVLAGTACTSVFAAPRLVSRPYAWIGFDNAATPPKGSNMGLDNVMIFKKSLSAAEMTTVYSSY